MTTKIPSLVFPYMGIQQMQGDHSIQPACISFCLPLQSLLNYQHLIYFYPMWLSTLFLNRSEQVLIFSEHYKANNGAHCDIRDSEWDGQVLPRQALLLSWKLKNQGTWLLPFFNLWYFCSKGQQMLSHWRHSRLIMIDF